MKAFLLVLLSCLSVGFIQAQSIRDTQTLRQRINAQIVPNNQRTISGSQLNEILNGILNIMPAPASVQPSIGTVHPGAITSVPTTGFDPNTTDLVTWINNVFFQSQAPTATLTGGVTLELSSGAPLPFTLNWVAGRSQGTTNIKTIVVAGSPATFTQPAAPGTVSGTQAVSVTRNISTTYSIVVTAVDNKTTTASTTFSFLPKRYFGWVSSTAPTDADIQAASGELSNSIVKSWTQNAPGGSKYLMYAYPSSEGDLGHFDINGFPSIEAMTLTKRTFTNALGYSQTYNIYVSKNAFTVTGTTGIAAY